MKNKTKAIVFFNETFGTEEMNNTNSEFQL